MSTARYPRTVDEIYRDHAGRKEALKRALTGPDEEQFYQQCDPAKENLCLYGDPDGTWSVDLPTNDLPPEFPEPCLGINFARDGMSRDNWLAFVAVHCDVWLLSIAYFYGCRLNADRRMINNVPTLFEIVTDNVRMRNTQRIGTAPERKPEGRFLTEEDLTPALLYWPDNKLWYEITVVSVDLEAKSAKVDYVVGETEELDLVDIIKDQHFNLLPAESQ